MPVLMKELSIIQRSQEAEYQNVSAFSVLSFLAL